MTGTFMAAADEAVWVVEWHEATYERLGWVVEYIKHGLGGGVLPPG